jgi:hypothetical protein
MAAAGLIQMRTERASASVGRQKRDEWLCGYAAGIACIDRLHDHPTLIVDALIGDGITIAQLVAAGVESFDLNPIKKAVEGASDDKQKLLNRRSQ